LNFGPHLSVPALLLLSVVPLPPTNTVSSWPHPQPCTSILHDLVLSHHHQGTLLTSFLHSRTISRPITPALLLNKSRASRWRHVSSSSLASRRRKHTLLPISALAPPAHLALIVEMASWRCNSLQAALQAALQLPSSLPSTALYSRHPQHQVSPAAGQPTVAQHGYKKDHSAQS